MATLARRGTGTPTTTGTTWAAVTNAVDGAAGTNPATYATWTNAAASAVATMEVTGYSFSDTVGASDTLNTVTVALRHFENNTGRFVSVTFQAFDGATAIGTATTCTLAAAARTDSATPAVTLAQLRSSTFKIRVTITGAASTQSRIFSIDQVDVTADYTPLPPSLTQAAYRFYADGTESGSTALAAQDTGYTADVSSGDVNLAVRVRMQSTNAVAVPATDDFQLQWERNTNGTWTGVLPATALVDSFEGTVTNNFVLGDPVAGFIRFGQSFLGNGGRLSRASFWLYKAGSPVGDVTAALYAHTGTYGSTGTGTGTALARSTAIAASSFSTTPGWVEFEFPAGVTLTAATPYVIVAELSGVTSPNFLRIGGATAAAATHAGNSTQYDTTWQSVSTTDVQFRVHTGGGSTVVPYASANLTDAGATTNRLGAGSGGFAAGKVSEDGLVDDVGWTASNYTELLYSITVKAADVANGDTLRFRVLRNGATTGLTYTQTPTVTITTAVAPSTGKPKVWTGSAWTEKPMKVWSGSAWVEKPLKVWSGSAWVLA